MHVLCTSATPPSSVHPSVRPQSPLIKAVQIKPAVIRDEIGKDSPADARTTTSFVSSSPSSSPMSSPSDDPTAPLASQSFHGRGLAAIHRRPENVAPWRLQLSEFLMNRLMTGKRTRPAVASKILYIRLDTLNPELMDYFYGGTVLYVSWSLTHVHHPSRLVSLLAFAYPPTHLPYISRAFPSISRASPPLLSPHLHIPFINTALTIAPCAIPPTFQSWFALTQLHVWMCQSRLRSEGREAKSTLAGLVDHLTTDIEMKLWSAGVFQEEEWTSS